MEPLDRFQIDQRPVLTRTRVGDAGRVYQLWFVTAGPPVSAALVTPDAAGRVEAMMPSPDGVEPTAFALTVEPAGGSPGPTGAMLLVGAR